MTLQKNATSKGRKSRVGKVCFDNGRMMFFVGYSQCAHCSSENKVLVNVDEARSFARMFSDKVKTSLKTRLAKWLLKGAEV